MADETQKGSPFRGALVGADAHIGPAECTRFTELCGKFVSAKGADVGIGPLQGFADTNEKPGG